MQAFQKNFGWAALVAVLGFAMPAFAQLNNGTNPECLDPACGTPKEEGGGCGCGCGCSVWVAYTDDGKTLSYTDDADGDGKADDTDNCAFASNRDQLDGDGDGVGDTCDNCKGLSNFSQLDTDGDTSGDVCDSDLDGDSILNTIDNCANIPNGDQKKTLPGANLGDVCNNDDDGDLVFDAADNCPLVANPGQAPNFSDLPAGKTSADCKLDTDADNISDNYDNCPGKANTVQDDTDSDGLGDVCDLDLDNDGVLNPGDNCMGIANRTQLDADGDARGDLCDSRFCQVVDPSNVEDCLDPNGSFKVHGGGAVILKRGEKFRLPLFANRNGAAIEYTWTVTKRPSGSTAAVENPKGAVTLSRHFEYAYTDGHNPSFTADADGEFTIQVTGKLAFPDRAYPASGEPCSADGSKTCSTSTSELRLSASPDGKGGAKACSMAGLDAPLMGLGLALLAMIRRRRS